MRGIIRFTSAALSFFCLVVVFQNCGGGVRLSQQAKPNKGNGTGVSKVVDGKICSASNYQITAFYAVNLTAKMVEGVLHADSDMDGVPDDKEVALSFDPLKARSYSLIDSLCSTPGGAACAPTTCDATAYVALGLTECDLTQYTSPTFTMDGYDSNRDNINDYVSQIRGLSPISNQLASADPDLDGNSNIKEIQIGTDPGFADAVGAAFQMNFSFGQAAQNTNCSPLETEYEFGAENIPLLPEVKGYTDLLPDFAYSGSSPVSLSHPNDGDNLIAIFYVAKPVIGMGLNTKLYVNIKPMPKDGFANEQHLTTSDFVLIGEYQ